MTPRAAAQRKIKIGVTLDAELLAWVRERTGAGLEFSSVSHGLERAIHFYRGSRKGR